MPIAASSSASALRPARQRAQQDEAVDREQEAGEIAEQGGVGELGHAGCPRARRRDRRRRTGRRARPATISAQPRQAAGRGPAARRAQAGRAGPAPAARSRRRPARRRPSRTIHGPAASEQIAEQQRRERRSGGGSSWLRFRNYLANSLSIGAGAALQKGPQCPPCSTRSSSAPLELPNRILMAPLTRGRATREHVPTPIDGRPITPSAPPPA